MPAMQPLIEETRAQPKRSFVRVSLLAAVALVGLVCLAPSSGPRGYAVPARPVPQAAYAAVPTFSRAPSPELMAKGFGKPVNKPPPKPKPMPKKTAGETRRDEMAASLDKLKATGYPEYMVLIREAATDGAEPSKWYPVGGIAVPRSSSLDTALSLAIYENEEDLLKGAYKAHPFLKVSKKKLEYGYRVKEYPDEPVKVADPNAKEESDNPLTNWFNALDNPLNDGSGWLNR